MKENNTQLRENAEFDKKRKMHLSETEIEHLKQKYDYLIQKQNDMPGCDKAAEAVIKYYLFLLDEWRKSLPYDAMGCESTIMAFVQHEFQKKTIIKNILEVSGISDVFTSEKLKEEVEIFLFVYFRSTDFLTY